jgi:hypothetical protein
MIALLIFLLLVALQWVRIARAEAALIKYRHSLFELRDRLRRIAIEDARLGKNWLYPYLDSMISATIRMLPNLSAWQTILLIPVARQRHEKLYLTLKQLTRELGKPANTPLRDIYEKVWQEIANELSERHLSIKGLIRLGRAELDMSARMVHEFRKLKVALKRGERRSLASVLLEEPRKFMRASMVHPSVVAHL